jgi:formylglycine-generating enzyme required for sulfatase activity
METDLATGVRHDEVRRPDHVRRSGVAGLLRVLGALTLVLLATIGSATASGQTAEPAGQLPSPSAGKAGSSGTAMAPPDSSGVAPIQTGSPGMVLIQPGSFVMGSPDGEPGRGANEQQHEVTITRPYYLCDHEVTQTEWTSVMHWNPARGEREDMPIAEVTWYDCVDYCNKRSEQEKLTPAYDIDIAQSMNQNIIKAAVLWNPDANGYRLPTEAEWEYACRAGTKTPFSYGACLTAKQGAFNGAHPLPGCPGDSTRKGLPPVKSFAPNSWGLYDMHGSVYEWCWDWLAAYPAGAARDPRGPKGGERRVFRSGGWNAAERFCRSACREDGAPTLRSISMGVRVCRNGP